MAIHRHDGGGNQLSFIKLGANGLKDPAYGERVSPVGQLFGPVRGADGKFVAHRGDRITRLLDTAQVDTAFGVLGERVLNYGPNAEGINKVAVGPDGSVAVLGYHLGSESIAATEFVARLTPEGDLDTDFGGDDGYAEIPIAGGDIAVQDDGKIVVSGATQASDVEHTYLNVMRLTTTGSPDSTFGGGDGLTTLPPELHSNHPSWDMAFGPQGQIVVSAPGEAALGWGVAKLSSTGAPDNTFGGDGFVDIPNPYADQRVNVAYQADGKVLVAGGATQSGTHKSATLLRLNANGSTDTTFTPDGIVTHNDTPAQLYDGGFVDVAIVANGSRALALGHSGDSTSYQIFSNRYKLNDGVANPVVTPTSVDFGSVAIGGPGSTKQVKLQNTGDGTLNVSQVTLNGPFTAPDGTGDCVGNLAPSASCEIDLEFSTTDTSTKTGSLVFTHNATGSPITVPLTGSGYHGEGESSVNVSELQFGSVLVGSESAAKTASLTNVGDGPLHISDVTAGAPFTLSSPDQCDNKTLQPSQSCGFNVRFAPSAAGPVSSTIAFATDAPTGGRVISLKGTGVIPPPPPPPPAPNTAAAGTADALRTGANAPSTVPASEFVSGILQQVESTGTNTTFVAQGGGLIGQAGTNLIGQAGTNLIGQAGTNLITDAGGGLIGQAGTNLIGQAGTNLIGQAGTNLRSARSSGVSPSNVKAKCPKSFLRKIKNRKARKKAKCKKVVLATGIKFLAAPGRGTLLVKPTSAGKKLIKRAMRYAKAQRRKKGKRRRKLTALTMSYATVVQPGGPGTPAYYTVKKLKIKP